ncbi:MAG TPA: RNA 2',3'-cyclic phosphodiesterase, partial [Caldisericia bacterium]|nr:RNA 2',3'-cyclic phosphodiesterase [Caldisericia bacterium]
LILYPPKKFIRLNYITINKTEICYNIYNMRTFLALPIEENLKDEISKKIDYFKKNISSRIKWVERENLHFTIFFFGEIEEKQSTEIIKIIEDKKDKFKKIKILFDNISFFPDDKNPRVIFYQLKEGEKEIKEIYDTLFDPFSKITKLKKEDFKAHLTIGRIKERIDERDLKILKEDKSEFKVSYLNKITFFESKLTPQGPIYKPLENFILS